MVSPNCKATPSKRATREVPMSMSTSELLQVRCRDGKGQLLWEGEGGGNGEEKGSPSPLCNELTTLSELTY
jgi:hypothetical protein